MDRTSPRLALVPTPTAPPLGWDGTPTTITPAETAELCARHADALAAQVETAARLSREQLATLRAATDTRATLAESTWEQVGLLRALAAGLGELHGTLDELGAELAGHYGGAS